MNLKALYEKRDALHGQMTELLKNVETENRAMSEEERASFDALEKDIKDIDETIAREERARGLELPAPSAAPQPEDRAEAEEKAFVDFVLGYTNELRAGEQNVTMANNAPIIPTSIANRIIKAVKDRSPILARATVYHVKGNLQIPVWGDADGHNIAVGYKNEFEDLVADAGKFTSVDLGGFLAGALTLIGRSVENNAAFSVVDFIVDQMAEEIAYWIEGQLLAGTGVNAAQGALNTQNTLTAAAAAAVTADELITLQAKVKQAYQANACWIMHPDTFTAIRKLKDGNNRYLLQDDITGAFPYRLLGKPVFVSDNMPAMAAGKKAILYGDCTGLSVNWRENIGIQILREQFAVKHAIGVIAWMEFDAKVSDHQKLAVLTMKAS